jgi:hypothetical protein
MKLSRENVLEIMEMNLESLHANELDEGCILISEEEFNWMLKYLIAEERYEDCQQMTDKKEHFVGDISSTF